MKKLKGKDIYTDVKVGIIGNEDVQHWTKYIIPKLEVPRYNYNIEYKGPEDDVESELYLYQLQLEVRIAALYYLNNLAGENYRLSDISIITYKTEDDE